MKNINQVYTNALFRKITYIYSAILLLIGILASYMAYSKEHITLISQMEQTMTELELMEFDGIEVVKEKVQNGQTLMNMINQLMQKIAILEGATLPPQGGVGAPNTSNGNSMGQAQKNAQTQTMTGYGERLAKRANPDMNNG